jgi:signal transduction histidine kinase
VEGLCREISEHHKLEIRFVHQDIPAQIPKDLTLCIFRIVQESLRNVVKHSGASKAKVELIRQFDRIDLFISDQGAGFDAGPEGRISGLGLISMRERLRLVSGQLFIESQPSRGTRIRAHVPLRMPDAAAAEKEKAQGARA